MQKYAWLLGPMAPGRKYAVLECSVCNIAIPQDKWTNKLNAIFQEEKKKIKTPLRMWRGTVILLLLLITPFALLEARIANPFNFKRVNNNELVNKTNVQDFKINDVFFICKDDLTNTNEFVYVPHHYAAKVIKTEEDKTTIALYDEKFEFLQQYDIQLSDLEDSKFKEQIEVKTQPLRTLGNLVYYIAPAKNLEYRAFGRAFLVIK
ncbi:hypothetical protein ACFSX9_10435 [Flavobacterium ardleyense]|uniref:Uncharacterized protein n=1 Tax=Flavobacterium ardleyense TaxID=2038737 RepID=A0ABW5ZAL6_9FLAO